MTKASGSFSACVAACSSASRTCPHDSSVRARVATRSCSSIASTTARSARSFSALAEPLPRRLRPPEHGERPGAVLGELVAQHRVLDLAEDDERLVDRVQRRQRPVRGDLDDGEHVVRVGVTPAGRELARDADGLRGVVTPLVEAPDAPERDGEVAVRAHRGRAARGGAREGGRVVLGGRARIGEAHRQVAERHRHGGPPRAVLEPLGHVLGEAQRVRRIGARD